MSPRVGRGRIASAVACGLVALLCVCLARLPGIIEAVAYLAPAVICFLLVLSGRYPGEHVVLALAGSQKRRRRSDVAFRSGGCCIFMPRGGALMGAALAGRAPPARRMAH